MTALSSSLIFSILFIFSFITPSHEVSQETLATICSQTQNQETCEKTLRSDPRTDSADLPLLSLISIELTEKQANTSLNTYSQLYENTTVNNPLLKTAYNKCVSLYKEIVRELGSSYELSKQGKYEDVVRVGPSTDNAYACENELPFDPVTAGLSEDMLLTLELFLSVGNFVAYSIK